MNNSSFYAWQDIHDNRSHKHEDRHLLKKGKIL